VLVPPGARFLVPIVSVKPRSLAEVGRRKMLMTAMAVTKMQESSMLETYRGLA
jgi:hypothetical protein